MTKPTLDKGRSFTEVGGMLPLKFMQNGHGFNRAGEYLGEFNGQGEKVAEEPPVVETANEPATEPEVDLESDQNPDPEQGDLESEAPAPQVSAESYKGVKQATMLKEAEELGLDVDPTIDRDDLINLLVAAKAQ